jgi:hypothetical protein
MADQQQTQPGNGAWDFEALGTATAYMIPLSSMATSNSLLSRSVRRGGGAACRRRSQVAVSGGSSTAEFHTKAFNILDELARYSTGASDIEFVGIKNLRSATISLELNPTLPWGDHYDPSPFA